MAGVTVPGEHGRAVVPRRVAPRLAAPAVAAALSLAVAWVHLAYVASHLRQWWAYGAFFLAAGVGQALFAPLVLRRPGRLVAAIGIAGNLAIVGMYVLSRTAGPPLGPHAHVPELVVAVELGRGLVLRAGSPRSGRGRRCRPRTGPSCRGPRGRGCGSAPCTGRRAGRTS